MDEVSFRIYQTLFFFFSECVCVFCVFFFLSPFIAVKPTGVVGNGAAVWTDTPLGLLGDPLIHLPLFCN